MDTSGSSSDAGTDLTAFSTVRSASGNGILAQARGSGGGRGLFPVAVFGLVFLAFEMLNHCIESLVPCKLASQHDVQ